VELGLSPAPAGFVGQTSDANTSLLTISPS
jgi:hypothetical protein